MAETKQTVPSTSRRRGWLRKLAIAAGSLVVLLVVLYFVATSSAFVKGVILPRVSKSLNAEITVTDASISPFSQVVLKGLTVKTTGSDPLLQVQEVRLRYSLRSILGGNIKVDEVTVASPVLTVVQNADGTSNLDPLLKKEAAPAQPSAEPSKPLQLDVRNVAFKNVKVVAVQNAKDGSRQTVELPDVNVTLDQLKNGAAGKLTLAAAAKIESIRGTARDSLQSKGSGSIDFTLGADLMPQILKGKVIHEIEKAEGSFRDFAGHRAQLDCDVTPTEVKTLALNFYHTDKLLGSIRASGPLDTTKREGSLTLEVKSIDRQVLNLAGAAAGIDFGSTTLNGTSLITITKGGNNFSITGGFNVDKLSLALAQKTTPVVDLRLSYDVALDRGGQSALIKTFTLDGSQKQHSFLRGSLTKPMTFAWAKTATEAGDATFEVQVTDFNLADWKPLLGDAVQSGRLQLNLTLASQQAGKQLKLDTAAKIQDLTAQVSSNKVNRVNVQAQATARVEEFKNVVVDKYSFGIDSAGRSLLSANGSANYTTNGDLGAQITLDANLAGLLQQVSVPQLTASAGALKFTGLYSQKAGATAASGNLAVTDLTARYGDSQFQNYQATVDYGIEIKQAVASIRRLALAIRQGAASGGTFDLAGKYDLTKNAGEFTFNIVDLNQNALGPILAPALAGNRLVSISLNGKGSAGYDANGESAVKAELKLANLVVEDPEKKLPKTPLSVDVQADGTLRKELLILKQLLVGLMPTDRAKNQLQLSGKIDLAKTNAAPSEVALRAESLDVTPYYDLFAGPPTASAPPASSKPVAAPPAPATPRTEPEPISLPLQNASIDAKIDRLYLREVAVSNLVAVIKAGGGRIAVKPFQFTVNGAPVSASADLDLGVKGWTYDVAAALERIPLDPFVNSFMPDSRGQYHGLVVANAQIKGAGITDASLQKNLAGQLSLSFTNASIQLFSGKPPKGVFGRLIHYTLQGIGAFLRVNEITSSPLNSIYAMAKIGDGKVDLTRLALQSQAFEAHTQGIVPMQVPLTNSPLNLPLEFSLSRSLAQKAGMMPPNTPPDAAYAALPTFVAVKGTIGNPKTDYKELAIGGVLLKSGVGVAEKFINVDEKTGGLLKGVGNLLTGQGQQTSTNTNAPAGTNPPPKRSLFDLLPKKK